MPPWPTPAWPSSAVAWSAWPWPPVWRRKTEVVILERRARHGQETSSRNSEVIHGGMYYPTGSLKARLCVEGNRRLYELCARHDVPHARVGKIIVAMTPEEQPRLDDLLLSAPPTAWRCGG